MVRQVLEREDVIITRPDPDESAGAAALVIIALLLVAVIGYIIFAFNGPQRTLIERNTTITQPVVIPAPAAPPPSTPAQSAPVPTTVTTPNTTNTDSMTPSGMAVPPANQTDNNSADNQ